MDILISFRFSLNHILANSDSWKTSCPIVVLPWTIISLSDSRDTSRAIRFFSEPVPQLHYSWDKHTVLPQTETMSFYWVLMHTLQKGARLISLPASDWFCGFVLKKNKMAVPWLGSILHSSFLLNLMHSFCVCNDVIFHFLFCNSISSQAQSDLADAITRSADLERQLSQTKKDCDNHAAKATQLDIDLREAKLQLEHKTEKGESQKIFYKASLYFFLQESFIVEWLYTSQNVSKTCSFAWWRG